jgi:hypothetical protein
VPAARDFLDVGGIIPNMDQAIIAEEGVALRYDKNVVAILEERETPA